MDGFSVVRDDGTPGKVVGGERGQLLLEFRDGTRLAVSPESMLRQPDGTYRLMNEDMVIPVVEEELSIETQRVERGRVRVHKRVETREEVVDAPVTREEVVIERVPVNKIVEDAAPVPRDENGVLIIPLLEEVLVVEKRLLLREEVHVFTRSTTTSTPQTVVLRREVVEIEREEA